MKADCEVVKPYGREESSKAEEVKDMFDHIALKYDFMNRAMTFGLDKGWRKKAIKEINKIGAKNILDIACGTGDMAIMTAKSIPEAKISGIDLSPRMLEAGRRKVEKDGLSEKIELTVGDSLKLPFENESFDAVTVAFGVRNFENLQKGYSEMLRVLKQGGKLVVLELSTPNGKFTKWGYKIYTKYIIPMVGRIVSGDNRAYSYLPESIAVVPQREKMTELMNGIGFYNTNYHELTFGTCSIYTGFKPLIEANPNN